jgi:pyridoxine 5-phosphate synthase
MKTALSININKVALLRNSRRLGLPSVTTAALMCLEAGADGITVHPRPDERHIRRDDVDDLVVLMKSWPNAEFNIEGNPLHNLMDIVRKARPHQATFVPDSVEQSTSDHGWDIASQRDRLVPLIKQCHEWRVRVSLFMDPDASQMQLAKDVGADRVELYTESWAAAFGTPRQLAVAAQFRSAAIAAHAAGLKINAGHDLSLQNLTTFLKEVPHVDEVSIGHAFIGDSLEFGYAKTVELYQHAITQAASSGV